MRRHCTAASLIEKQLSHTAGNGAELTNGYSTDEGETAAVPARAPAPADPAPVPAAPAAPAEPVARGPAAAASRNSFSVTKEQVETATDLDIEI